MKQITYNDIKALTLCYDPIKYIPEDWTGTVLDILNVEDCPPHDRLWVVLREEFIDVKTLRLFAVWCAREALKLIKNPDARSVEACNVAERYANGEATDEELSAAYSAAYSAASSTDEELSAAYSAAYSAASSAAFSAASSAVFYAASDAASDAAYSAASSAAFYAASSEQINHLKTMIQ
jgi:hypothetical protein